MNHPQFSRFAALLCLMLAAAAPGFAQSVYGDVRGLVLDPTRRGIVDASVTLTDEGTGSTRTVQSNRAGEYHFAAVVPGAYWLLVEAPGFRQLERRGLSVATQDTVVLDLQLTPGSPSDRVVIRAQNSQMETGSASQGQVLDKQKYTDLPNLGRSTYNMAAVAPTVQQVGNPNMVRMQDQAGASQVSLAGGPARGNNYLIDGVSITDTANRPIIMVALEAIQEMKVMTNTYDAEVGRTGGGMYNVLLKSGGKQYHGALGGYMRNTEWMANTFFNNRVGQPKVDQPLRNYHGSFGGPVYLPKIYTTKNRTFFWGSFEGYRDNQGATGITAVPTMLERAGDFSQSQTATGSLLTVYDPATSQPSGARNPFPGNIVPAGRISRVGLAIAATFPQATSGSPYYGAPNMPYSAAIRSKADQKTIKVDQIITKRWSTALSYLRYNSTEPQATWFRDTPSTPQQGILSRMVDATQWNNTVTVSPSTMLAVRYGFNRFPNLSTSLSQGFNVASLGFSENFTKQIQSPTFPNVALQSFYVGDSMASGVNSNIIFYSRNLSAMLSKSIGKHALKLGADYRRAAVTGADYSTSAGAFTFTDQFTRANYLRGDNTSGADIASLLLGVPATALGFQTTSLTQYTIYGSAFLQDTIRLTAKLTLNLGLRWESETGLQGENNKMIVGFNGLATNSISQPSGVPTPGMVQFAGLSGAPVSTGNPKANKFAPRLGVAYKLDNKTTLRGGYGIYWAPAFSYNSTYLSEGFTASTQPLTTSDGGLTQNMSARLDNVFNSGLDQPVGASLGDQTGIGKALTIQDPNATSTRVQQFSFDVQRELGFGVVLTVAYNGSRTDDLTLSSGTLNKNQVMETQFGLGATGLASRTPNPYFGKGGANAIGTATVSAAQLVRPFAAFGNLNYTFSDYGIAKYDALVLRAQRRMANDISLLGAVTYSKNRDNVSGGAGNNMNQGNTPPQDPYHLDREWGLSYLDSTYRISVGATIGLPFGRGKAFAKSAGRTLSYLVGGWSVNLVGSINEGFPLQIRQNINNNAVMFASSQRPNATGSDPRAGGEKAQWIDGKSGVFYINPAAFSVAPALTFGNVSRTISMRSLRQSNADISVFKSFSFGEKLKAQFRAEALNATNTPRFRAPNVAYGSPTFGQIQSQANLPRTLQLGLRIFF